MFGPPMSERPTVGSGSSSSADGGMWRTPSAEEAGPRPETLSSADGGPPVIGRRIYRVSPTGRRYNTQQTIGLQAENWPTPQTSDAGGIADGRTAALSHTPENRERAQLYRRVAAFTNEDSPVWPTPMRSQGLMFRRQSGGRQGLTLEGRAERWSTPRAEEREQHDSNDPTVVLSRQAKLWPTPQASEDGKAGRSGVDRRRDTTLTEEARRWKTPRAIYGEHRGMADPEHLTGQAIELWQTPDATPEKTDFSARKNLVHPSLSGQATLWTTPTARDWKDGPAAGRAPTNSLLGRMAPRSGLRAPGNGTSGVVSSPSGPGSRPRLSSPFVEWLMGLPVGWTDFAPLGTPSSPPKPNSRSESSIGD